MIAWNYCAGYLTSTTFSCQLLLSVDSDWTKMVKPLSFIIIIEANAKKFFNAITISIVYNSVFTIHFCAVQS